MSEPGRTSNFPDHGIVEVNTGDAGRPPASDIGAVSPGDGEGIVSVNARNVDKGNRGAKAALVIVVGALIIGALALFGQNWLTSLKNSARSTVGQRDKPEEQNLANPEGTRRTGASTRPGAAGQRLGVGAPPPVAATPPAGEKPCDFVPGGRLLRGKDGRVITNAQGRAICVDPQGNVIEIPAIEPVISDKKPAPTTTTATAEPPKRSRYGGALFVADAKVIASGGQQATTSTTPAQDPRNEPPRGQFQERRTGGPNFDALDRAMKMTTGNPGQQSQSGAAPTPGPATASTQGSAPASTAAAVEATQPPQQQPGGSVGSGLVNSITPVARARKVPEMNLMLPRGRQADCVLTTRIVNEVAGFASCALTQNLYSANGRVLLLERGSELQGEYGTNQAPNGQRRLFMVWSRVMTPDGIEIDLQSPGTDPLGTSGVPGYLEQRWFERIGAALMLSAMKDVVQYETAKQLASRGSGSTVIFAGSQPGQNTIDSGQRIVEEVLKQTINIRPTLYINEGERIAIYVARDLDFSAVYTLRTVGAKGTVAVR